MHGEWVGGLIEDAARGDEDALNRLLAEVRPYVLAVAQARLQDRDLAEDVAQTVLLKLIRGLGGLRSRSRFSSWIRRIAFNESATCSRRERAARELAWRFGSGLEPWSSPDPGGAIDACRLRDVVRVLSADLPADQRQAVRRICLDGARPCEVAREAGRAHATVRASLCRGRQTVLRRLSEMALYGP